MTPRPKINEPKALEACAKAMAPRLSQWYNDEDDLETIENDLVEAIQNATPHFDAYQVAKYLENFAGVQSDSNLVDTLGAIWPMMLRFHREAQEKWVIENELLPPEIGWEVKVTQGHHKAGYEVGIVYDTSTDGTAAVSFPSLGHVGHLPKGSRTRGGAVGTVSLGYRIEWEKLERA